LVVHHRQLLLRILRNLTVLQHLAQPENAGQGIVQFMSESADHLSHRRKPLGLNDLLFQPLLDGDVTDRYDYAQQLVFRVEQWTRRRPHGLPVTIAVLGSILAKSELQSLREHISAEIKEFRRLLVNFRHFLSDPLSRMVAE